MQVGDKVEMMFKADTETNALFSDAKCVTLFLRNERMSHGVRMINQAFHTAETDCYLE